MAPPRAPSTAVSASAIMGGLKQALELVQNNSVFTLGQNKVYPGALACNGLQLENILNALPAACPMPPLVKTGA